MAQITIASVSIPNWQGANNGIALFIYVNSAFTSAGGTLYPATVERNLPYSGRVSSGTFYLSYPCTTAVSSPPSGTGEELTIPAITLDSSSDSPDNPGATYSAVLWDTANGCPVQQFGTTARWSLDPSYGSPVSTSTTWAEIFSTETSS